MNAVLGTRHETEPPITTDTTVERLDNAPGEPEDNDGEEETKDQSLESSTPSKKESKGKSPLKKMATYIKE